MLKDMLSRKPGRTIVIAVDEGPVSKEALEWSMDKIISKEDTIKLVTVVDPAERPTFVTPGGVPIEVDPNNCAPDPKQQEKRNKILNEFRDTLEKRLKGINCSTDSLVSCLGSSGDQGRHICEFAAENKADMIVLGSRGMGSFRRSIMGMFGLGSVSSYVVNHATVPNIIIHKHQECQ